MKCEATACIEKTGFHFLFYIAKIMKDIITQKAAAQFGNGTAVIEAIGTGLIHRTYKVRFSGGNAIILQCLNQRTFSLPENIIQNYILVYKYLDSRENGFSIPPIVPTLQNKYFWRDDEDNFWRATKYVENSYTISVASNEKDAYRASRSFAEFTQALTGLDSSLLYLILPNFHDLQLRYQQFEEPEYHSTIRQHPGRREAPSTKLSAAIPVITD